ncbi:hypothetical protein V6N13_135999 [Hibiscus sabdariffa]
MPIGVGGPSTARAHHTNAAQDAFDWNTPVEHQSLPCTPLIDADIPEASVTSKWKAKHSASLELSTNIDKAKLDKLTPTRIQSLRSAKKKKTQPRRKLIISAESDEESSESPVF